MPLSTSYRLRQPWLEEISDRCLDPAFLRVLREGSDGALDGLVRRPHAGVVEFPLFSGEYVEALLREIHVFEH